MEEGWWLGGWLGGSLERVWALGLVSKHSQETALRSQSLSADLGQATWTGHLLWIRTWTWTRLEGRRGWRWTHRGAGSRTVMLQRHRNLPRVMGIGPAGRAWN